MRKKTRAFEIIARLLSCAETILALAEARRFFKKFIILLGIFFSLISTQTVVAAEPPNKILFEFSIPQQQADHSLNHVAKKANITLIFPFEAMQSKTANAIDGVFTIEDALDRLLLGTGYKASMRSNGHLSIVLAKEPLGGAKLMHKLKKIAATVMTMAAATSVTMPVIAQEESPETEIQLEEVVVTGIRSSLKQALDKKRSLSVVADVINADDVGKLPDNNIAEALSRVPGVQVERDGNEGAQIQLRGLDSVRLEVNGQTLASPDAEPQATSLQIIPSQLFRQITVLKSYSADQVEGGLGGTVRFDTFKPFDFKEGQKFAINADLGYSDGAKEKFPRLNAYLSKTFEDTSIGDVGILYAGGIDERVNFTRNASVTGYSLFASPNLDVDGDGSFGTSADIGCVDASGGQISPAVAPGSSPSVACTGAGGFNVVSDFQDALYYPGRVRANRTVNRSDRQSHLLTLQWRPNDSIELTADYLRTEEEPENIQSNLWFNNQIERNPNRILASSIQFDPGTRNVSSYFIGDANEVAPARNGVAAGPVGANIFFGADSRVADEETENLNINLAFDVTDSFSGNVRFNQASGSRAFNRFAPFSNFATLPGGNIEERLTSPFQQISVAESSIGLRLFDNGTNNPRDILTYSPFVNGTSDEFVFESNEEDSLSIDFDWELDLGPLRSLEFGARTADQSSETDNFNQSTFSDGSRRRIPFNDLEAAIPGSTTVLDISDFTQQGGINLPAAYRVINPDLLLSEGSRNELRAFFETTTNLTAAQRRSVRESNINFVDEDNTAVYLKGNFEGELGKYPYQASLGLRYVDIDRTSRSATVGSKPSEINYGEVLPTFNAKLNLSENLIFRVGAARNFSRYEFGLVRENVELDDEVLQGQGGNGLLLPETVNSIDLSLEWYPTEDMALAAAVYSKKIEDFISTSVTRQCRFLPNTTIFSEGDRFAQSPFVNQCLDGSLGAVSSPLPPNGLISDEQLRAGTVALPFNFTGPVNSKEDVDLFGIELQYQQNFTFLPAPWDGLGLQLNYTYTDVDNSGFTRAGNALRRRGLSDNSYNVTGFYEKGPLEIRLAYNYRDDFTASRDDGQESSTSVGGDLVQKGFGQLEASISYAINDNLDLTFSAVNLLADDRFAFYDLPSRFGRARTTERTFFAGVKFRL